MIKNECDARDRCPRECRDEKDEAYCRHEFDAQRKKLTGPACTEALNEAEDDGTREMTLANAGGVRVEREVRRRRPVLDRLLYRARPAQMDSSL